MQNRVRFPHHPWPVLIAPLICAGALLWGTLPGSSQAAPAVRSSDIPMVLQGHVIEVQRDSITIRTPNIRPTPEPGKMTPMYIIAGETFKADTSQAQFESSIGLPNAHNDLKAGDSVVIVCAPISMTGGTNSARQPWPVTANVVERLQFPLGP